MRILYACSGSCSPYHFRKGLSQAIDNRLAGGNLGLIPWAKKAIARNSRFY